MESRVIGVDLGATNIRIGCRSSGYTTDYVQTSIDELISGKEPAVGIADYIERYISATNAACVTIGLPGTLDAQCRNILNTPNIPQLNGFALADYLESRLALPVYMENDQTLLLIGDIHRLGINDANIVTGVYIGTGLGCAVFIGGIPPAGRSLLGELGHVPVFGKKDLCGCGNRGCAERYVSGRFLEHLKASKYPDTHISDIFSIIRNTPAYGEYTDILASVIAACINLTGTELLIIGGGVAAMRDFPIDALQSVLRTKVMKPYPAEKLRILLGSGGADTGVLGAVIYGEIAMQQGSR